jgi:hypothetical protein
VAQQRIHLRFWPVRKLRVGAVARWQWGLSRARISLRTVSCPGAVFEVYLSMLKTAHLLHPRHHQTKGKIERLSGDAQGTYETCLEYVTLFVSISSRCFTSKMLSPTWSSASALPRKS